MGTARPVVATLLLLTVALGWLLGSPGARAATPDPADTSEPVAVATAPPVVGSVDVRSDGEGPGLIGSPVAIAVGVILLGGATVVITLVALRLNGARRRGS